MEPTKLCRDCGERRPWSSFYVNGRGIRDSYCKDCRRVRAGVIRRTNPAGKRADNRRYWKKLRADPERWALYLEHRRFNYERKHGRSHLARKEPRESVDGAPLAALLRADPMPFADLAAASGITPRTLRDFRHGRAAVDLASVEAVVIALGLHLRDVYPALYEDEAL